MRFYGVSKPLRNFNPRFFQELRWKFSSCKYVNKVIWDPERDIISNRNYLTFLNMSYRSIKLYFDQILLYRILYFYKIFGL